MLTHPWKYIKLVLNLTIFLMLIGVMGVNPSSVEAEQVVAAPLPEGVNPGRPQQASSILVESLSAGRFHTCALKSDGTVICWGDNSYSQSTPPAGTFTQVSADGWHTCGLKSDGTLACWGDNGYGQSTAPGGTFTQVSAGFFHTCGLKSDGTLACWGLNTDGQSTPPSGSFRQVSAGDYHTCGLKSDGTLACWGDNAAGQSTPPAGTFTQVTTGRFHSCGLKSDDTLACWGDNSYGQSTPPDTNFTQVSAGTFHTCGLLYNGGLTCWGAGTTNTGVDPHFGQAIPPAGIFTQLSAGYLHTCGLKSDGTLACWGAGTTNTGVYPEYGQSMPPGGALFGRTQVSAGGYHTCWLKTDSKLACWGNNNMFQAMPPTGTFTQVSAGYAHTCVLKSDGDLFCWGDNTYGQAWTPPWGFTQVSASWHHTCGVKSNGTLACWGENSSGQSTPPTGTFTQVSAGRYHSCGLKSDGTLACWGTNSSGQSTPPTGTFTQVSAYGWHNCGLRTDGTLACWGDNSSGESTPPPGTFTQVSAGISHTCGLKSDGTLACWGAGTTDRGIEPDYGQAIPPAGTFTQVSAGDYHTCGLKSDGTLVCWGWNASGQCQPFTISGNVGVGGATLSYTDGSEKISTANSIGTYFFQVSYSWSGTVTPSKAGYTFSPASHSYTNVVANQTGQDYTATAITPTISGNAGVVGATLSYHDGSDKTATSGKFGSYSFTVSYNWSGTVTPTKIGYTFSPASRSYTNVQSDQTGQDYTATTIRFTISGNAGDYGVTLSYHDGIDKTVLSGEDGSYSFTVSYNWSGTVTPTKTGYIFKPHYRNYTNVLANLTAQNYEENAITYTISGNAGVALATLSYTDGSPKTATADGSGNYSLAVSYNWSGTVTPSETGYTFTPVNRSYTNVLADQTGQDYTAALTLPGAFSKISPTNGSTGQPGNPSLSWGTSSGATSYQYCIDTTNNNTCNTTWTTTGTNTSDALSGLSSGNYYWAVRSKNAAGTVVADKSTTPWWSFTVTSSLPGIFSKTSPANGATSQPATPTLSWGTSSGVTSYQYCIDTANDNTCNTTWTSTGTSTSVALSGLSSGKYYWAVRAKNAAGTVVANKYNGLPWWSFTVTSALPGAFSKISPANGATGQPSNPTLSWGASSGATSYEFCIDMTNDNTCGASWISTGTNLSAALNSLIPGKYYWAVRAKNAGGTVVANKFNGLPWWSFTVP